MKIVFPNDKIKRLPHIVECLKSESIQKHAPGKTLTVMAGLGAKNNIRYLEQFDQNLLVFNSALIPEMRDGHKASCPFLGSPCPSKCKAFPSNEKHFLYLSKKYNIPHVHSWKDTKKGPILILLPRSNGWKYPVSVLKNKALHWIASLQSFDDDIIVRFHPMDKCKDDVCRYIQSKCSLNNYRFKFDNNSDPNHLVNTAKFVATPWGSAHIPYMIRGVKCLNLCPENPRQLIGHPCTFIDPQSWHLQPSMTPYELCCLIFSNHFDVEQFKNGDFTRWLLSVTG